MTVFPMYVGVIPGSAIPDFDEVGIPHVRGGDPATESCSALAVLYSPCTWG